MKSICCVLIVILAVDKIDAGCLLSLGSDFGSPSPVFLRGAQYSPRLTYLEPNTANGSISLPRGGAITVACPGSTVKLGNSTGSSDAVDMKCVSGTMFSAGAWRGALKDVSCDRLPYFTAELTTNRCYHQGQKTVNVGYTVRGQLYPLYIACFDQNSLTTLFVQHQLSPNIKHAQSGRRPSFTGGDVLFGAVNMANVYKLATQKNRINAVLGAGSDHQYITKKQFLTRGHLAANADFTMRAQQRATFHYVNTAPQWMRGNGGDWAALEDALRRRVHKTNSTVNIFTGTHGVLTLPGAQGDAELYLHSDENNNVAVPVPLYFYKIIHDPVRKTATAFVLINSSFYNEATTERLTFCNDVCGDISWLKWRNDETHSFCCSYGDFVGVIDHITGLDVEGLYL